MSDISKRVSYLLDQRSLLLYEVREIDDEIKDIRRICKHKNTTVTEDRDWVEGESYTNHTCQDCGKHWVT